MPLKIGLFFGGGFDPLEVQLIGVGVAFGVFAVMLIVFSIVKGIVGLRVSDAEQLEGLDIGQHGNTAYSGLVMESTRPTAVITTSETERK